MRIFLYITFISFLTFSCKPKCQTCPHPGKQTKYQKQQVKQMKKMEKEMNKEEKKK